MIPPSLLFNAHSFKSYSFLNEVIFLSYDKRTNCALTAEDLLMGS